MLKAAAARGAATAYAVAGTRPFVRIEGEVVELGMEPVVGTADIERFAFEFAPRNDHGEAASEWVFSLPEVGRVHAVTFADESGPGLVLHIAANVSTAEQIGLSHEAQKLCTEADGLVLVTGPRRNGKSTLLGAFVDLISRRRTDYVVTIESRIRALHERRHALISQREVEGDGEAIARAARAALREGPDVLVLDDIRAPEAVAVALDAARSGRLVIAALAAPSAASAIDRLIDGFPTDRRPQVRALLASSLRGVISQLLVEKKGGGRIAARELLLGTPAVSKLVLDGATAQLGVAMESAARAGMRTLPQALAGLVRDGLVEAEEAYRHVPDQRAFLLMLQRESVDVAESERRA
jgi:twitching motility protein PilT